MTSVTYVSAPFTAAEALLALGASYDARAKQWAVPSQPGLAGKLDRILGKSQPERAESGTPRKPRTDPEHRIKSADVATLGDLPITTRPWDHQRRAYWWALPKKSAYLAIPMGGGKSALTVALRAGRKHKRTLILAPKKVVPGWANQFAVHGDTEVFVSTLNGRQPVPARVKMAQWALDFAQTQQRPAVIVTNYESLQSTQMQDFVRRAEFDFVVADELHRLKAHNGLISKTAHKLFKGRDIHRLGLSGTPLPHSPLDAFGQMRFLDDALFSTENGRPLTWTQFRLRYARWNPFVVGKVDEWINQDELAALMEPIMFQVDRSVLDLPPAHHIVKDVELGPKALGLYRTLERDFYAEVESGEVTAGNALTRILRLQQISAGFVKQDDGELIEVDAAKREMLEEVLDELPTHEPVVVFCRFMHDLDTIKAVAEEQGRRYGEVSGRRDDLVNSAMPDDIDVLGAQIQAGGVGVNLTRAAVCVFYTLSYALSEYDQALARTHRPGQTRPVTYVHLVATNTIDGRIYRALDQRRDVVQAVLGRME